MRPKKPESISRLSLRMPGRKSLSCTTPCFTPACSAARQGGARFAMWSRAAFRSKHASRRRSPPARCVPSARCAGVEVDGVVRIGEAAGQVGAPASDAMRVGDSLQLPSFLPTRMGSGIRVLPSSRTTPPCSADGEDRADQMLIESHASGDAVHDDSNLALGHTRSSTVERDNGRIVSYRLCLVHKMELRVIPNRSPARAITNEIDWRTYYRTGEA